MSTYAVREFKIGVVFEHGFRIVGRNFVSFLFLALVFYGVSFAAGAVLGLALPGPAVEGEASLAGLVIFALFFLMFLLLTATLTYGTYREMRGDPAGPVACITKGLPLVLPVLAVALVSFVLIFLGMLALIVPGFVVMTMLWLAIPIAVIERPGIVESLARSRALTKGYRLHVFGIVLLIGAANVGIDAALRSMLGPESGAYTGLSACVDTVFLVLQSVMPAVGYFHLRSVKEGIGVDEIADVFD